MFDPGFWQTLKPFKIWSNDSFWYCTEIPGAYLLWCLLAIGQLGMEHRAEELLCPMGADSVSQADNCTRSKTLLLTTFGHFPITKWCHQKWQMGPYSSASISFILPRFAKLTFQHKSNLYIPVNQSLCSRHLLIDLEVWITRLIMKKYFEPQNNKKKRTKTSNKCLMIAFHCWYLISRGFQEYFTQMLNLNCYL